MKTHFDESDLWAPGGGMFTYAHTPLHHPAQDTSSTVRCPWCGGKVAQAQVVR